MALRHVSKVARCVGFAAVATAFATGCSTSSDSPAPSPVPVGSAGLALSVDALADSDVAGFRIRVDRVACHPGDHFEPGSWTADADLLPFSFPGGLPGFEGSPFGGGSHSFADHFFTLPEGCYDVVATPLDDEGHPADDCSAAHAKRVRVEDGDTTEILLVSQCKGEEVGGLDVIAGINHAPTLTHIEYNPSKFACPGTEVTICATAHDPDGDPLEFVWQHLTGGAFESGPTVISHETDGNSVTECVTIVGAEPGAHSLRVKVYDLVASGEGMIRMEDWLNDNGYDGAKSHDSLTMPLYFVDSDKCDDILPPPEDDVIEPDVEEDVEEDVGPPEEDVYEDVEDDILPPEEDVEEDVEEPGECTRTQGYWKNHEEVWPISTSTMLCGETWLDILGQPVRGDAWVNLAHQYIAARLNVAAGTDDTAIAAALLEAGLLLSQNCDGLEGRDRERALELKDLFDSYNNGHEGPEKCK